MKANIKIKDYGDILIQLKPDCAPITVDNFVKLASKGFYNGLIFHRIIKNFMIQGGDPKGNGTGGPGYSIQGEFLSNGVNNPLQHKRGVISMARAYDPNSAGSQFFIMHKDGFFLDGQYAAFGEMLDGFDVLDKVASVPTNANDKPHTNVIIESILILED